MLTSNAGGSSTVVTTGYSTFALQHAVSQWRIAVLLPRCGGRPLVARPRQCLLWVDDADETAAGWQAADVEVHQPQDTAWGRHEGAGVDPDENVIGFGSPMGRSTNRGPSPSTK